MHTTKEKLVNPSDFIETVISTKINCERLFEWSKKFFSVNCKGVTVSEREYGNEGTFWFISHRANNRNLKFNVSGNNIWINPHIGKEGLEHSYHHIRKDKREILKKYLSLHTGEFNYFTGKTDINSILQTKNIELYVDFLNKKDN